MRGKKLSVTMKRREWILGLLFLPCYLFLFGFAIRFFAAEFFPTLDADSWNLIHFILCGICVLAVFWDFLNDNFRILMNERGFIKELILFLARYYLVALAFGLLTIILENETGVSLENRNDSALIDIFSGRSWMLFPIAVILAPLVEESIFRGLIFSNLQRASRFLAYAVTILCFSAIHVVDYAADMAPLQIIVSLLQYLPATFFLCRIYERCDSIFAPMVLHGSINLISLMITSFLYGFGG